MFLCKSPRVEAHMSDTYFTTRKPSAFVFRNRISPPLTYFPCLVKPTQEEDEDYDPLTAAVTAEGTDNTTAAATATGSHDSAAGPTIFSDSTDFWDGPRPSLPATPVTPLHRPHSVWRRDVTPGAGGEGLRC